MENQDQISKNDPKGPTEINEAKPVGYGSSIQSDGNGNRTRPPHTADVNPTTEQDHIQEIKESGREDDPADAMPKTDGTGGNRAVDRNDSLIIEE